MASAWLCLSVVCCTDTSLAFNMPQPNPCLKQRLVSSLYVYTSFNQVYLRISSLLLFDRIGSFSEHAEKRKTISIKIVYKKLWFCLMVLVTDWTNCLTHFSCVVSELTYITTKQTQGFNVCSFKIRWLLNN